MILMRQPSLGLEVMLARIAFGLRDASLCR